MSEGSVGMYVGAFVQLCRWLTNAECNVAGTARLPEGQHGALIENTAAFIERREVRETSGTAAVARCGDEIVWMIRGVVVASSDVCGNEVVRLLRCAGVVADFRLPVLREEAALASYQRLGACRDLLASDAGLTASDRQGSRGKQEATPHEDPSPVSWHIRTETKKRADATKSNC
jgi:hypothetical protein